MWWKEPTTSIRGIGKKKAADLAALNINTVGDLLEHYPRQESYMDFSRLKTIAELATDGSKQIFKATVHSIRDGFRGKIRFSTLTVCDETGYADVYFFMGQRYWAKKYKSGTTVLIVGRVKNGRVAKMVSEAHCQELGEDFEQGLGIVPTYSLAGALTQKNLQAWVKECLAKAEEKLPESLPSSIIKKCGLCSRVEALKNIHFPKNWQALADARKRLVFEELFLLQCGLLFYRGKQKEERQGLKHGVDGEKLQQIIAKLPFELTPAQKQAWLDISLDMQDMKPMHRILQGDVGSGKTVVSALALAKAAENGYQGCIMAPTEILAVQHYETLTEYLAPFGMRIALLKGGMRAKERRSLLMDLELGLVDIVVGTHALIQDDVRFAKLSLVVTDEQHRFGVEQRAKLANKSTYAPDVLIMTATPIPRTLALTVYGDLDVSLMKDRPPGRKPVQTLCYTEEKRKDVYAGLVRQVEAGRQAYIVCPLIENSEMLNARSAENVYDELVHSFLENIPCALLHGKLKPAEKDAIMADFNEGKIKVLVSTTVIEVGVNVPNATLMVVENAERFGLAQLHQLRGRVGRGSEQSYCVLLTSADNPETLARLQVLRDSDDGFYLAEKDLEQRGAGQLFGLRQHGLPDLRIADILRDTEVIVQARSMAQSLLKDESDWQEMLEFVKLQLDDRFQMIFNT